MRDVFPSLPGDGPAERPVREPSRPYGVRPTPPELVRAPAFAAAAATARPRPATAVEGPAPSVSDDLHALIAATEQEAPASAADAATARSSPAPPVEVPVAVTPSVPSADAVGDSAEELEESTDPSSPLRPRQEAFCHYFVLYGNATTAAAEAGYAGASCKNQGYRLLRRPGIRARIAEIRAGLAATGALDADVLLGKLEALYQRAVEDHHFHAAARAVELQARIAGHVESRARLLRHVSAAGNDDR